MCDFLIHNGYLRRLRTSLQNNRCQTCIFQTIKNQCCVFFSRNMFIFLYVLQTKNLNGKINITYLKQSSSHLNQSTCNAPVTSALFCITGAERIFRFQYVLNQKLWKVFWFSLCCRSNSNDVCTFKTITMTQFLTYLIT